MKDFELRKSIRLPTSLPVKFRLFDIQTSTPSSPIIHGQLRNVSFKGLCLETNTIQVNNQSIFLKCLQGNKQLLLEVELPDIPLPLRMRGNVIWFNTQPPSSTYRFFAGINIIETSEDTLDMWKKYLKEHKESWYKNLTKNLFCLSTFSGTECEQRNNK